MDVSCETFEDGGEQDEQGHYAYYYRGKLFTFRKEHTAYLVRQYWDEPDEAHFLSDLSTGNRILFESIPYDDDLFRLAVRYLLKEIGVRHIQILLPGGYTELDLARAGLTSGCS